MLSSFTRQDERQGLRMKQNTPDLFGFTPVHGKKVTARFEDAQIASDGGLLLVAEVERTLEIIDKLAGCIRDGREAGKVRHQLGTMFRQRVMQICAGYEDADDCDHFRHDPLIQTIAGCDPLGDDGLASQPSMSRLENAVDRRALLRMGYAFVDQYMDSFAAEPEMVVLDMDPTSVITYGDQQLRLFNAFEDEYCLMPFHVYDGLNGKFITAVIRPGKTPTAGEILAVLKRLVRRLRGRWRQTRIILRADSHHTKPEVMDWLEANGVGFITGLGPNSRLDAQFKPLIEDARKRHARTWREVRLYGSATYAAGSWGRARRVICRVVVNAQGVDTRYVVTSFEIAGAKYLYETVYCGRGKAELMIKDHKTDLRSDRCSCHAATANQFRLFLHSAAYVILHKLRARYLQGTELATARFSTIRQRLIKIGTRVEVLKTAIRFFLPASFPLKDVFAHVCSAFRPLRI
jgi:hypothetical protein